MLHSSGTDLFPTLWQYLTRHFPPLAALWCFSAWSSSKANWGCIHHHKNQSCKGLGEVTSSLPCPSASCFDAGRTGHDGHNWSWLHWWGLGLALAADFNSELFPLQIVVFSHLITSESFVWEGEDSSSPGLSCYVRKDMKNRSIHFHVSKQSFRNFIWLSLIQTFKDLLCDFITRFWLLL